MANVSMLVPAGTTQVDLPDGTVVYPNSNGVISVSASYAVSLLNGGLIMLPPSFTPATRPASPSNGISIFDPDRQDMLVSANSGVWCGRRGDDLLWQDDFLGSVVAFPTSATAGSPWIKKMVKSAGTPTFAVLANTVDGVAEGVLDATAEKQEASLYFADQLPFSALNGLMFEARVKLAVLPTLAVEAVIGLNAAWSDGPDAVANSAYFWATGNGVINCRVSDNSTPVTAAAGVTVLATQFKTYRVDFTQLAASGTVRFFIDGVQVAAATTFPFTRTGTSALLQPYFSVYKASGAGLGTIDIDYVRIWQPTR